MPVCVEIDPTTPGQITIESAWKHRDMIRSVPGTRRDKGARDLWVMPLSWVGCLALRGVFEAELQIGPELAAWATDYRAKRVTPAMELRDALDADGPAFLFPHQRADVKFLALARRALLGNEPGCISGDAQITYNRSGNSHTFSLREFHRRFVSGRWYSSIPTRVKSLHENGALRLNDVVNVLSQGTRPVVCIRLASGKEVVCTDDHEIAVGTHLWKAAGSLQPGDTVLSVTVVCVVDKVLSVEPAGEVDVYDLVMAEPARNFVVDGVVVHNCGKTASAVRALAELARDGEDPFPALVVAPTSVKQTWKREFDRFWPGLEIQVIKGTAVQRRKQLNTPAHAYVINYEALRAHSRLAPYGSIALRRCPEHGGESEKVTPSRCEVHPRELNDIAFKTVIADEFHRIKDPQSKQSRALWAATGDAEFRYGLSGTPISKSPDDLWSVLHWMSPEEYPSRTRWTERMLDVMYNAWGGRVITGLKPTVRDEFYAGFDPRFRRMTKEVVLPNLPPILYQRRDVEMTTKQQRAYSQMSENLIAMLDSDVLTAPTRLTQTLRLLQLASSYGEVQHIPAPTEEDPDHERTKMLLTAPSNKVDALMADLEDFGEASVVVFAVSRQLIDLLSDAMTKAEIPHGRITGAEDEDERTANELAFQEGKTQFILCTVGAGGTGITLTKASIMVFLQRSWSPIEQTQATNRCVVRGSLVQTESGLVPIENIKTGQRVLTHQGRWMPVSAKAHRRHKGLVTDLIYTRYTAGLSTTSDHLLWVLREANSVPEWVQAAEVQRGDFVALPRSIGQQQEFLPVPIELQADTEAITRWAQCAEETTCRRPVWSRNLCSSHYSRRHKALVTAGGSVRDWPRTPDDLPPRPGVPLPGKIHLNQAVLELFGRYTAEGCIHWINNRPAAVRIAGHENEYEDLQTIANTLKRYFGLPSHIHRSTTCRGIELSCTSVNLAQWFYNLFSPDAHAAETPSSGRYSYSMRLPAELMNLSAEQSAWLLNGYVEGDGYRRRGKVEWTSMSIRLASQMCTLAARCGYAPTLRRVAKGINTGTWIGGYTIDGHPDSQTLARSDQDWVWNPVREVLTSEEDCEVWDLTVPEDHSFVVGHAAVHNCHRLGSEVHESILHIDYVTPGTFEDLVIAALGEKEIRFEEIVRDEALLRKCLKGDRSIFDA